MREREGKKYIIGRCFLNKIHIQQFLSEVHFYFKQHTYVRSQQHLLWDILEVRSTYHRVCNQQATQVNIELPSLMAAQILRTDTSTLNSENIQTSFMRCFSTNWSLSQPPRPVLRFQLTVVFYNFFSQISFTKDFMESHNTKKHADFVIFVCLVKQEIFIGAFLSLHHHQKNCPTPQEKKEKGELNTIFSISCYRWVQLW